MNWASKVRFKGIVGDDAEGLTAAAKLAMRRSDIIIFTGGLGPTEDDLTREAVADRARFETATRPRARCENSKSGSPSGAIKMSANNAKQPTS